MTNPLVIYTRGPRGPQGASGAQGPQGPTYEPSGTFGLELETATTSINANTGVAVNSSISLRRACLLFSIELSRPGWLTLYSNASDRTADASRIRTTAPELNSGVIADPVFTAAEEIILQPSLIAINVLESNTFPFKLVNDGSSGSVIVTIKYMV